MSELRPKIDRLTNEQKGDALEYYLSDNLINESVSIIEKTIRDFIGYVKEQNIVAQLDNKDDKAFDRATKFMKDLIDLSKQLEEVKMSPLNVERAKDFTKKAAGNGILAAMQERRGG